MRDRPRNWKKVWVRGVGYSLFIGLLVVLAGILLPPNRSLTGLPLTRFARVEMYNLASAMDDHRIAIGSFPAGENATILKTLLRENAMNIVFFNLNNRWLDTNGTYVDPWRTPYDIRIISTNMLTIRSAGKNRRFGDKDDIVIDFKGAENQSLNPSSFNPNSEVGRKERIERKE